MFSDEQEARIRFLMAQISEQCDACQVLASFDEDGMTYSLYTGAGNWFARQGMAKDFLELDQAQTLAKSIISAKENDE